MVLEVGFVVTGCWSLIESRIGRWVDCEVVVSGSTLEVAEVITDEALGGWGRLMGGLWASSEWQYYKK